MLDNAIITVHVEHPTWGQPKMLRYQIGPEQADALAIGTPPPEFDVWGFHDWRIRRDRAEKLAQLIAADLAHVLLSAFQKQ